MSYDFTGGDRGWKGDVPVVRLNTDASARWAGPIVDVAEALRPSLVACCRMPKAEGSGDHPARRVGQGVPRPRRCAQPARWSDGRPLPPSPAGSFELLPGRHRGLPTLRRQGSC